MGVCAAERKGRPEHGSALARALFVPLPGTKSDKASSSSFHKSGAVFHEKIGIDLANPTSLSSKIGQSKNHGVDGVTCGAWCSNLV